MKKDPRIANPLQTIQISKENNHFTYASSLLGTGRGAGSQRNTLAKQRCLCMDTKTFRSRIGMIGRTYGWGSWMIASKFQVDRSVWGFFSSEVIMNSLFKRSSEAFSTHSTNRPLLSLLLSVKAKSVNAKTTSVKHQRTSKRAHKIIPTGDYQWETWVEIPIRMLD